MAPSLVAYQCCRVYFPIVWVGCMASQLLPAKIVADKKPSGLPSCRPQLEEILFPMMWRMLSSEGQDVFEEILDLVAYFTYFAPAVSARMWTLWPRLHQCFDEWAIDSFDSILVPLDNFISRGTEVFLTSQSPNYLASANQVTPFLRPTSPLCRDSQLAGWVFVCVLSLWETHPCDCLSWPASWICQENDASKRPLCFSLLV